MKVTVYAPLTKQDLGEYTVTVTWDAGNVHFGYCYINKQYTPVAWDYESRIWIVD